jgi:hypothetical protein
MKFRFHLATTAKIPPSYPSQTARLQATFLLAKATQVTKATATRQHTELPQLPVDTET